jgi:hypothetical protein
MKTIVNNPIVYCLKHWLLPDALASVLEPKKKVLAQQGHRNINNRREKVTDVDLVF